MTSDWVTQHCIVDNTMVELENRFGPQRTREACERVWNRPGVAHPFAKCRWQAQFDTFGDRINLFQVKRIIYKERTSYRSKAAKRLRKVVNRKLTKPKQLV